MRVVDTPGALPGPGTVLAIGTFDGVHLGHRALLTRMRELADETGGPAAVIAFFPPAKTVFVDAPYLSSREEKLELLAAFAPDGIALVPFTREYARTPKEAFLAELATLSPAAIVVGEDFRFGRDRGGGLDDLQHVPERLEVFGLRHHGGEAVKSSRIRDLLAEGDVGRAGELLGAAYPARGTVVHGDRRGRTIGFPTANLRVEPQKALPSGVFAVRADTPHGRFGGMANVGARPSFPDGAPSLEVHLFDFDDDLYDRHLTARFVAKLRDPVRFDGLDALRAQLAADEDAARAALGATSA